MSEIVKKGEATVFFHLNSPSYVLLTLKSDGTYELPGTVEELLAHDQPTVQAFGAALRDHYEAGRQGVPAPKSGGVIESDHRAVLAEPAPEPRFKAIKDASHSCCNDASVVDTTKPVMIGGKHYNGEFEEVCETHAFETAEKIAAVLNAAEPVS
jgi:hypothetical protein